jgi:hypothetical protein
MKRPPVSNGAAPRISTEGRQRLSIPKGHSGDHRRPADRPEPSLRRGTHLKSNSPSLGVFGTRRKRQTTASGLPPRTLPTLLTLPGTSRRAFLSAFSNDSRASSRAMAKPCLDATLRPSPPSQAASPSLRHSHLDALRWPLTALPPQGNPPTTRACFSSHDRLEEGVTGPSWGCGPCRAQRRQSAYPLARPSLFRVNGFGATAINGQRYAHYACASQRKPTFGARESTSQIDVERT